MPIDFPLPALSYKHPPHTHTHAELCLSITYLCLSPRNTHAKWHEGHRNIVFSQ